MTIIIHLICRISTYDVLKKCKVDPKNYKTITKEVKKSAKLLINEIIAQNETKFDENNNKMTLKLVITREQKDQIKALAKDILIDEIYAKYDDLTNKQLCKAVVLSRKANYKRVEWNKKTTTYGMDDQMVGVMDFFKYIGWYIKGQETLSTDDIKAMKQARAEMESLILHERLRFCSCFYVPGARYRPERFAYLLFIPCLYNINTTSKNANKKGPFYA